MTINSNYSTNDGSADLVEHMPETIEGLVALTSARLKNILKPLKEGTGRTNANHASLGSTIKLFNSLREKVVTLENEHGHNMISRLWKNTLSQQKVEALKQGRELINNHLQILQEICERRQEAIEAYNNGGPKLSKNDQMIILQQVSNGPNYFSDAFNTPFFKAVNSQKVNLFNEHWAAAINSAGNVCVHTLCTNIAELFAEAAVYIAEENQLLQEIFLEQEKLAYEAIAYGGKSISLLNDDKVMKRLENLSDAMIETHTQFAKAQKLSVPTCSFNLFNNPLFRTMDHVNTSVVREYYEDQQSEHSWKDVCKASQQLCIKASYLAWNHRNVWKNMIVLAQRFPLLSRASDHLGAIEERCKDFSVPFSELVNENPVNASIDFYMKMREEYEKLRTFGDRSFKNDIIVFRKNAELSPTTPSWKTARNQAQDPYFHISKAPGIIVPQDNIYVSETLTETKKRAWQTLWKKEIKVIVNLREDNESHITKDDQVINLAYGPQTLGEERQYGDIAVKLTKEEDHYISGAENNIVTRRTFLMRKGGEERTITQLHVRCWEDRQVPDAAVMHFLLGQVFEECEAKGVLFHCKSGIGRAGTTRLLYNYYRNIQLVKFKLSKIENQQQFREEALKLLGNLELEKLYMYTLFIRNQIQGCEQMTFMRHMIREMTLVTLGMKDTVTPFPVLPAQQRERDDKGNCLEVTKEDIARAKNSEGVGRVQGDADMKTYFALLSLYGSNREVMQEPSEQGAADLVKGLSADDAFGLMMRVDKLKRSVELAKMMNQILASKKTLKELEELWKQQVEEEWKLLPNTAIEQLQAAKTSSDVTSSAHKDLLKRKHWGFRQLLLTGQSGLLRPFLDEFAVVDNSSFASTSK